MSTTIKSRKAPLTVACGGVRRRAALVTSVPILAAACGLSGSASGQAGGAGSQAIKGKIALWGWPGNGATWTTDDFTQGMLREFEAKYLGVTVEPLNVQAGGNPGDDKFLVAASGGEPPDLFSTGRSAVAEWGINGVVAALDDRMKTSKTVKPDVFVPGLIEEGSWKGKAYGLSHSIDTRAFYWSKDLYTAAGLDPEKPPDTWDDLVTNITKAMKQASGKIEVLGYHPTLNDGVGGHYWETWLWELGGKYLTDDGQKVAFNTEAGIKALEWMQRLTNIQGGWDAIQEFYTPLVQTTSQRPSAWLLGTKHAVNDICTGGGVKSLRDNYPDVRFGVGNIPKAPATGKRASVRGGYFLVLASGAKNPDAAWKFVEFHLSKDVQIRWADRYNRLPATREAASSPVYLKNDPLRKVINDVAVYSQRIPAIVPGYADILTINGTIATNVLSGKMSPRDALSKAERDIQAVLDQWKGR